MSKFAKHNQFARPVVIPLLVALIIFLSLLGASPELHKFLHSDANNADHECAVTLFAHGQIDAITVATLVAALISICWMIAPLPETIQLPLANYRFSRGRAPPSAGSHLS